MAAADKGPPCLATRPLPTTEIDRRRPGIRDASDVLGTPGTIHPSPTVAPFSFGPLLNWVCVILVVGIALVIGWECKLSVDHECGRARSQQALATTATKTEVPRVARITGMVDCQWAEEDRERGERRTESLLPSADVPRAGPARSPSAFYERAGALGTQVRLGFGIDGDRL